MIGATLEEIRTHIEKLASEAGDYYLVCARYGDRPVPASGLRFESRATAQAAARATEQYRTALRRYDPQLPYYDVIVCQDIGASEQTIRRTDRVSNTDPDRDLDEWTLSDSVLDTSISDRQTLVEFCHRVAAAVFETLSEREYEAVESAIMDAYFDLAERLSDPDDLCLCLLESMARELDQQLRPVEQAEVLCEAATRLPAIESADQPVSATLARLEERGLLGSYTQSPWSVDLDGGTRSVVVRLSEYALSPQHDRLPVLPIVLELHRHQPDWLPSSLDVVDIEDGWRLTLVQARETEPSGLASAPIQSE